MNTRFANGVQKPIFFANGYHVPIPKKTRVVAATRVSNEDWKTALAHKQRSFGKGEQGTLVDIVVNFYGSYALVDFDGVNYSTYVKWSDLEYLENGQ